MVTFILREMTNATIFLLIQGPYVCSVKSNLAAYSTLQSMLTIRHFQFGELLINNCLSIRVRTKRKRPFFTNSRAKTEVPVAIFMVIKLDLDFIPMNMFSKFCGLLINTV